jgi:anti-anti-sigma regulatory factor
LLQNPNLIVDLGHTFHVSGAGLVVLDQLTRQAKISQGTLQIIAGKSEIDQVIKSHKFGKKLELYPDLGAALME